MNRPLYRFRQWSLALAIYAGAPMLAWAQSETLKGELAIHDPSTIVQCKGEYWVYGTGRGIRSKHSKDLLTWEGGPSVFQEPPGWTQQAVPGNRGFFWAPDVIRLKQGYFLYYSVSTWGSRTSAIGLATNATLDPGAPAYSWHDCGIVVQTSPQDNFNAIDPSVLLASDGKLWLAFGSYWSGIRILQLNPATGLRLDTNAPPVGAAWQNAIEAACLHQHQGYYYLFVNWDQCCKGTNSTYNIRVGRSRQPTGPYLDKSGTDMLKGGGTLILDSKENRIGPGHAGIVSSGRQQWLSYHFYDALNAGKAALGLARLRWTQDGWPALGEPVPSPF